MGVKHPRDKRRTSSKAKPVSVDYASWAALAALVCVSYATYPTTLIADGATLGQVWYYGWITAVSTGLGVVPFFFFPEPDKFWMGVSNAVACGMMLTASASLLREGAAFDEITGASMTHSHRPPPSPD
jgi:hypothetical protein